MKSRLIKFACHNCGTKLAVPPEMAGVTDQCPKCGTTITAPQESSLELPKRKTRFGPVPKAQAQPDVPALPGWSASELADALRPPAPLPTYNPAPAAPPVPQHTLQPDPPAIPEPEPVFTPKRKPRSEGSVAVAPAPAVRSDHPVLGSILDSPNVSRGGAGKPTALQPGLSITAPPLPPPSLLEVPPALAPAVEPEVVSEAPAVPPLPPPPPLVETPALTDVSAEAPAQQLPTQETVEPQAEAPETMAHPEETPPASEEQQKEELTTTEPQSSPTALVPESLPDARAAEDAAMPGMGEVLAGQVAQDPSAPPDARDHRPLLHVPFLPVAESPLKERRLLKRKMYIAGVVLFFIFDAALAVWFFTRGAVAEQGEENTTAPTNELSSGSEKAPMSGVPNIGAPSDFVSKEPGTESLAPPKPTTPPMAIPLPGHASANVPTATPIPSKEVAATNPPKAADPAPAPPPAPAVPPAPTAPTAAVEPTPEKPPAKSSVPPEPATAQAPPTGSSQPVAGASSPGPAPARVSAPSPAPPSPASDPSVAPSDSPPAGGGAAPTIAAIMGPQPTPPTTITEADPPPWLKRVAPTFPAIDGTPLLPAAGSQPVAAPPPLPPAPGSASTPPGPANSAASPTPGDTTPPASSSTPLWVGKAPAEAQSALTTLRSFLAAPTWQERAAYVQKPDLVKPAMEKHAAKYGDGPIVPATIKFVDRHPGKDGGPPYCMFEIDGGDLKHEVLVLVEQPAQGQPLVDWASFVEFKDDLLLKFLETKGEPNQTFRVLLSRKHYFAKDVPDLASKDSFQVQQPNDRFDGHVFLPKSTALSKKLATQLGWNQNMPVIVELAWRTNGKLHWVEMVSIVSYGWRG